MPDWTQMKENLKIFNLRPIWDLQLKPFRNENSLKKKIPEKKTLAVNIHFTSNLYCGQTT